MGSIKTHTTLPSEIQSGDTLQLTESLADWSAASWTLRYTLKGSNREPIRLDSTASGTDHAFTIGYEETGKWKAGAYVFQKYVDNTSGEKRTLYTGSVRILPNLAEIDPELSKWVSIHEKTIQGLEDLAEGKTTSFSVAGQSFTLLNLDEAIRFEKHAKKRVADLRNEEKKAAGLNSRRRISARM